MRIQNLNIATGCRTALVLAAAMALGACATATPYQPADSRGHGYKEQRLQQQRYRVAFSGNNSTSREVVENYLLYRASEIALQNDSRYFSFVGTDTDKEVEQRQVVSGGLGFGGFSRFGTGIIVSSGPTSRRFDAHADVVLLGNENASGDPRVFDAQDVQQNLGPLVVRPSR
jgi:hypothetical protein